MRSIWTRHESVMSEGSSLDPVVRDDVVVGEAELSMGVAKVAGAGEESTRTGVGAGEESTRTGVGAGEESTRTGVGAGEESTRTGVGAGEKLMSASVAEVAGVAMRAGEELMSASVAKVAGAGEESTRTGVGAGEESTRTGVGAGEESTRTGVGAGEESTRTGVGAGEKLMSASVVAIADKVFVAMDALSASMLACHTLQNTATNEQHNPACSRPCTKP